MAFPENRSLKQGQIPDDNRDRHWDSVIGGWVKDCGCIQFQDGLDRCDMHINQLRDEAKQEKARVEKFNRDNSRFNQGTPQPKPTNDVTFVTIAFTSKEMESMKLVVQQQVIERLTSMLVGDIYQQMKKGFGG